MKKHNYLRLIVTLALLTLVFGCASKEGADESSLGDAVDSSGSMGTPGDSSADTSMSSGNALAPIYFDYNQYSLSNSARNTLKGYLSSLQSNGENILIEGHCDERGTDEYNTALGERRAKAIRDYLVNLGIPAKRVSVISYGEERPAAYGQNEDSWAKNRRGEFILSK